jgi:hypothetical protein
MGAPCLASETWVANSTHRILYVLGQFSAGTPQAMHAAAETIGASSFNVVILSFLQAAGSRGKLSLNYNGNDIAQLSPMLPALFRRIRSGFPEKKQMLLSIGGWQQTATFAAIRDVGAAAFVRQLSEQVIVPFGLDGIDLDLEPDTGGLDQWIAVHREFGKVLADVTNEYKRLRPEHIVTHAPLSHIAAQAYAAAMPLPGLPQGLLAATRTARGNNIDWLNVQLYAGSSPFEGDIAAFYRDDLVGTLAAHAKDTGIRNALDFCVPLFQPQAKQSLAVCRQAIRQIDRRCADLHLGNVHGAALWEYAQIASRMEEWSQGLETALHA